MAPRGRRPVIGMLTTGLFELYEKQWLGAVDAAARLECDFLTFIGRELDHPDDVVRQANAVYDLVSSQRVDGLVIWTTTLELFIGHERMEDFARRFAPLPIVSVEHDLLDAPVVLMQNRQGMYDVVHHLLTAHGHRRVGFLRGPSNHTGAQERYHGYLDALTEQGIAFDPRLVSAPSRSWEPHETMAAIEGLLAAGPLPDAIATANDDCAIAVLSALQERGVRTPEDVAVVGYDDFVNLRAHDVGFDTGVGDDSHTVRRKVNVSASTVSLTTVRTPMREMAGRAVEVVHGLIRGEDVPPLSNIPTELVIRRSCGCFPSTVTRPHPATLPSQPRTATDDPAGAIEAALESGHDTLPDGWATQLATAFTGAAAGERDDFLAVLDEYVRLDLRRGGTVERWWRAMLVLRSLVVRPDSDAVVVARAEDVWLRVQNLLNDAADRYWQYAQVLAEKRDQIVREVGQRLITTPDVAGLAETMAEELPKIGIPRCYVAAYEWASVPDDTDRTSPRVEVSTTAARLVLCYENGERVALDTASTFPAELLVPGDRLQRDTACTMVVAPLFFKEQQLGFVLFEAGPRTGWIYEAVQEQVASALQGAFMVERERRALAAVEEARRGLEGAMAERAVLLHETRAKNVLLQQEIRQREDAEAALQRARAELEQRVVERTTQLARANEVLREQIVERERAEEMQVALETQLRHAQKMEAIGRLAGGIAHDFNNLLVVINGNSDGLLRRMSPDDPDRDELEDVKHAGERAANLTRQLLAFSRQQVLHPRALNLNDVILDVQNMLQRLIGEDIELTTRLARDLAPVWADAGQLEQIIFNVAVNARDAMPDGGELTIETEDITLDHVGDHATLRPGPHVVLRIRDTGIGMDDAVQTRLFEPFFTTKPVGKGTGLGLATVFGIVQQSGGHIVVNSAPSKGTTFEIYLPQLEQEVEEVLHVPPHTYALHGSETVLLVEDDDDVRAAARRFLVEYGYTVHEAADGHAALRLAARHPGRFDLVVTDVVMPGMGGRELATHLASTRPGTPVLFVSGYADNTTTQNGSGSGLSEVLQKPFTAHSLVTKVREVLDASLHTNPMGRPHPNT